MQRFGMALLLTFAIATGLQAKVEQPSISSPLPSIDLTTPDCESSQNAYICIGAFSPDGTLLRAHIITAEKPLIRAFLRDIQYGPGLYAGYFAMGLGLDPEGLKIRIKCSLEGCLKDDNGVAGYQEDSEDQETFLHSGTPTFTNATDSEILAKMIQSKYTFVFLSKKDLEKHVAARSGIVKNVAAKKFGFAVGREVTFKEIPKGADLRTLFSKMNSPNKSFSCYAGTQIVFHGGSQTWGQEKRIGNPSRVQPTEPSRTRNQATLHNAGANVGGSSVCRS